MSNTNKIILAATVVAVSLFFIVGIYQSVPGTLWVVAGVAGIISSSIVVITKPVVINDHSSNNLVPISDTYVIFKIVVDALLAAVGAASLTLAALLYVYLDPVVEIYFRLVLISIICMLGRRYLIKKK